MPGKVNYFVGSDPAKWHAGIPTYAKVRYSSIYPGIDLLFHGNPSAGGQLEFDFVVAPHADPRVIHLRFSGATRVHRAANGDLVVSTADGSCKFLKPTIYQLVNGRHVPAEGEFTFPAKNTVGFRLGRYDRAKTLVIDPGLVFSTFLGGSGDPNEALIGGGSNAIAVDAAGNTYVTGSVYSTSFPVTQGAFQATDPNASFTSFVTKLNAAGTALVYSTYLGGSGADQGSAIAVDAAGNAYVAGQTDSTNFPVTAGALQKTNKGAAEGTVTGFVAKLNPSGTSLIYSTYVGGSTYDGATAIAVDAAGDAYVVGQTSSTDFPVTQGAYQTTNNALAEQTSNAFVAKLNPAGTALIYATYLGGSGGPRVPEGGCLSAVAASNGIMGWALGNNEDGAFAVAIDAAGDAYVAGQALSTDFPVTQGAFQTQSKGAANPSTNAFVAKLNPAGSALIYSTYLGGSGLHDCGSATISFSAGDTALALAVDSSGDAYLAGIAFSSDFPVTQGAFQTTNQSKLTYATPNGPLVGGPTGFIAKLNPSGSALLYSTYLGGSGGFINISPFFAQYGGDQASGLAIDGSGNAYVTGSTASPNFPVTSGAYQTTNNYLAGASSCPEGSNGYNAFVTEINPAGSALVYSTYLGGNGANPNVESGETDCGTGDVSSAMALDNSGNVYLTGQAQSANFPVTSGAFQTTNPAFVSPFVAKLNIGPSFTITATPVTIEAGATTGNTSTITVTPSGGFTGSVALTAALASSPNGAANPPTLSFGSTSSVNISGTTPDTATLTIATTAAGGCTESHQIPRGIFWGGGGTALACLLLLGISAKRRRWRLALAMAPLLIILVGAMLACGGAGTSANCNAIAVGTTPGTYTITVTGTSGTTTAMGTVTVTVQ